MRAENHKIIAKLVQRISIALYLISLTQQCYCVSNICNDHWSGISLVFLGAIGGIMSSAGLTWYANPALWAAWSLINKDPKKALFFSFLATVIAASFLLFTEIADTQPGMMMRITGYRSGYWLWLSSMVIMLIGSLILYIWKKDTVNITTTLKVDFNNTGYQGVKLTSNDTLDELDKNRMQLYGGLELIVWGGLNNDKMAVEAIVKYSDRDQCWVAEFNKEDLKRESERKKPLLSHVDLNT